MVKQIDDQLLDAVETELNNFEQNAPFDKTVQGRILASLGGGLYSVSINNITYKVFSVDKNAMYAVGDIVKVVVQQNDYNKLYIPVQSSSVQVPTAEAVQANLEEHENNTDIHTSASEKTLWNSKLDSNSDGSNLTNTFSAATSRVNLTTGEKISASLGKIAKWFSDLKNVAFSGSYNDLSNKPSIPSALSDLSDDASHRIVTDTEKSIWNSKQNVLSGDITTHYHSSDRSRANHTGTQTASTISDFNDAVSGNSDVSANTNARHTHSNKTVLDNTTASYTTVEQTKLSGIESGANKYVHPTGDGNSHVPVTGTTNSGKVLTAGSTANSASWVTPTVTWGNISSKPSSSVSAIDSAVSEAHTHNNKSVLDTTTASYTTAEKNKLSGIEANANKYILPAASTSSLGGVKVGANLTVSTDGTLNANDNPASFIMREEAFTVQNDQTTFTLTKGTYEPNANRIFWYWNRVKQNSDVLIEDSSTTVSFPSGVLSNGDEILFDYIEVLNADPLPLHGSEHLSDGIDPIPNVTTSKNGLMSPADKTKLDGIATSADVNKIETVQQNGTSLSISNKTVNVTVPTKTSDITNDSGFITSSASIAGNAGTATKLTTARTISLTGDATGSTTFDGSANKSIATTLANSGVTAGTYPKVTVDIKGRVTNGSSLSSSDIPNITLNKISDAGTAASKNTGVASGNVPVVGTDGKIDSSILPAIAITNTFVVDNQNDMLALSAQTGDVAVRNDLHKSFILQGTDPTQLSDWQELQTPTDAVQSVAGKTGTVTLTKSDVGLSNVDNTADSAKNVLSATKLTTARTIALSGDVTGSATFDGSGNRTITTIVADDSHNHVISNVDGLQSTLDTKAPLDSPALTGVPTAPTPTTGTNTDQIATTKFVQSSLSAGGYGDMLKSQYDTDNDGVVDNTEKLNGMEADSPSGIATLNILKRVVQLPGYELQKVTDSNIILSGTRPEGKLDITVTGKTIEIGTGDKSPDNPYTLVGTQHLQVAAGKNLLNKNNLAVNSAAITQLVSIDDTGFTAKRIGTSNDFVGLYIPTVVGQKYTVSFSVSGTSAPEVYIYSDYPFGTRLTYGDAPVIFTATTASTYIGFYINSETNIVWTNIQVELGPAATPWEPFKGLQLIQLPQPLYSLPDGTADEYDAVNGQGSAKTKKVVFNGGENWTSEALGTNTVRFGTSSFLTGLKNDASGGKLICSHLVQGNTAADYDSDRECIFYTTGADWLRLRINKSRLATPDVAGLQAWLQANPVTAILELAEPVAIAGISVDILPCQDNTHILNDLNAPMDVVYSEYPASFRQGIKADNALPASSYTASDVLSKLKTIDGSGSGIDSDLLDGNDSSFYKNIQISLSQPSNQRAGDLWFQVV